MDVAIVVVSPVVEVDSTWGFEATGRGALGAIVMPCQDLQSLEAVRLDDNPGRTLKDHLSNAAGASLRCIVTREQC